MTRPELLSLIELDFLWESHGEGELPYPLRAPSHGATMDERAVLRQRVLAGLTGRGVLDGAGRPAPHIEEHFEVLARSERSLDSVQLTEPGAEPLLAVTAVLDGRGTLAVQDTRGLHLQPIEVDGMASAIVSLLPPVARGTEKSITVPLAQLLSGSGVDFLQRRATGATRSDLDDASAADRASADRDRKALARLHAQERIRGGQIGANARDRTGGKARSPVLSWFDTETGRYFTQATRGQDGRDWITIAPADPPTLRHRFGEMLAGAAGQR